MAGKLKGVIPAVTPRGKRYVTVSMSLAMLGSVSPRMREGMEQHCSTTSVEGTQPCNNTITVPQPLWREHSLVVTQSLFHNLCGGNTAL